jgi:hypothetical protein
MKHMAQRLIVAFLFIVPVLFGCGGEKPVDIKRILAQERIYVGSDVCKMCHLEHYDSWKETMHSRMTQDAQKNRDAIIAVIDEKEIRQDLAKLGDRLKVPVDSVYIPKMEDIKIVIGSEWKQRYVVQKDGDYYVAPIEYNSDKHTWLNYYEQDWNKRSWLQLCAGCHATGVDIGKKTYTELGVACEACHGKGSWHAALPKTAVFEKRQTIVNPAKLTSGVAAQICGSCHTRAQAAHEGAGWAVGYEPGRALQPYFRSKDYEGENVKQYYAADFSKGHHQQFIDWKQSQHFKEGVTCTSCHYVHQLGIARTGAQTLKAGSQQCLECHQILNKTTSHAIHSFANCVGCHMARIAVSEESGLNHSHTFICLIPKDTMDNPELPNSCQPCHKHKDANLKELQQKAYPGSLDNW